MVFEVKLNDKNKSILMRFVKEQRASTESRMCVCDSEQYVGTIFIFKNV